MKLMNMCCQPDHNLLLDVYIVTPILDILAFPHDMQPISLPTFLNIQDVICIFTLGYLFEIGFVMKLISIV